MGENNWKEMCWHGSPPCEDCWQRGETALDPISSAVLAEREACAKVAEDYDPPDLDCSIADGIAEQIRARKSGGP